MVEVHCNPDQALSDGMQSLYPDQFDQLMNEIRQIAAVLGREVPGPLAATIPGAIAGSVSATANPR
jgi:sialic acid synthase SpsE